MTLIPDVWLSLLLGYPAWKEEEQGEAGPPSCTQRGFYTAKIPTDAVTRIAAYEQQGFRLVTTQVTLEHQEKSLILHPPSSVRCEVLTSSQEDRQQVRHLAGVAFQSARFAVDPVLRPFSSRIKRAWVESYLRGERDGCIFIAKQEEELLGFLAVVQEEARTVIDLIAVREDRRGEGIGTCLLQSVCQSSQPVRVGTQLSNLPSLRLYQRNGFRIIDARYVLHLHQQ